MDAASTPSASAASQVRAGCKSLVDSLSRFVPLAMPRRGAALLAGRMRRSAVRSIVFALLGRRAGQSRPNCLTDSRSHFEIGDRTQFDAPGGVLLSRRRRREPWVRELSPVLLAAGSRARARGTATAPRASHSSPGLPHASLKDSPATEDPR